jgi:hypothetical protein
MFAKDFKLPCRHAWAVALKENMLADGERAKSFYKVWVDPCYWLDKYIQGYSELDIQIPNVYEGDYEKDPKYGHPDREVLNPPSARREKKKGHTKLSRHTSGGEVGRKNGRTKKKKQTSVSSGDEPPDAVIHAIPFAELFGEFSSAEPEKAASEVVSDEDTMSPDSAGEQPKSPISRPSVSNAAMTKASRPEVVFATPYVRRGSPDAQPAAQPAAQLSADGQDKKHPGRTEFVYKRGFRNPGAPRRSRRLHGPQLHEKAASKEKNASPSHVRTPPPKVIKAGGKVKGGRRLHHHGQPDP